MVPALPCQMRRRSQVSFHHAETVSLCMYFVQTIKLRSGSVVCRVILMYQTLKALGGRLMMMAISSLSECARHRLQMQSWNCYPVSAHIPANYLAAPVLLMDLHVPTCANYRHAAIRRRKSFMLNLVTQMMMQTTPIIDMFLV